MSMDTYKNCKVTRAWPEQIVGSRVVGSLSNVTFDRLVDTFGPPHHLDPKSHKVRCEWNLVINDYIVTIYDWAQGRTPIDEVTKWHVGGFDKEVAKVAIFALTTDIEKHLIYFDKNSL